LRAIVELRLQRRDLAFQFGNRFRNCIKSRNEDAQICATLRGAMAAKGERDPAPLYAAIGDAKALLSSHPSVKRKRRVVATRPASAVLTARAAIA